MKKIIVLALASLLTLSLIGCSKSAPSCGDSKTKDLVKKIMLENNFPDNEWVEYFIELKNIRTVEKDKETGMQICTGDVDVQTLLLKDAYQINGGKAGDKFQKTVTVDFTSEITSDKDHYVKARVNF